LRSLLVKDGDPVDSTLCGTAAVFVQVHVTVLPTATVSTAGFTVPFRLLLKRMLPTRTDAEVGIGATATPAAVNVSGEPVRPSARAVIVMDPIVPPTVTFTAEMPDPSVAAVAADGVPPVAAQATLTPGTPFPN
jgi:hypothetical protein